MDKTYPMNKEELEKRLMYLATKIIDLKWTRPLDMVSLINNLEGSIGALQTELRERGIEP